MSNNLGDVASVLFREMAEKHDDNCSLEDIYYCFRLLLGRNPNPEEIVGHSQAAGIGLMNVVRKFIASDEFRVRQMTIEPLPLFELVERDGYFIYADPNDADVGRHVISGEYEPHVTEIFKRFLQPGQTVVDIGANIGFFSALAAHLVGPTGKVVSIEPNSNNCRYLEATKTHNNFSWQEVFCVAASQKASLLALHSGYSNGRVSQSSAEIDAIMRSTIVQSVRLDSLLSLEKLDFIKIDIEGYELDALKGFQENISRFRPTIVSEFTPSAMLNPIAYLEFLYNLDYYVSVLRPDGILVPCEQEPVALMSLWQASGGAHVDILATQKPR